MSNLLVVKDKVQRYARELYSDVRIDSDGDLRIPFQDTDVFIRVWERTFENSDQEKFFEEHQLSKVLVNIWTYVLVDLPPALDLFKWVAIQGQDFIIGHCVLIPVDESESSFRLLYANQIAGDTLDPGELKEALLAVEGTSVDLIELLKPKFGGKTFREASQ